MLIDPKSNVPIFRQIADQLRDRIHAGIYKPGEMLPSLRSLALDIRVNPNTVQRAYETLEREGAVYSKRGVGIFVSDSQSLSKLEPDERRTFDRLAKTIGQATKSGLTPDRIRSLFEDALRGHLVEHHAKGRD